MIEDSAPSCLRQTPEPTDAPVLESDSRADQGACVSRPKLRASARRGRIFRSLRGLPHWGDRWDKSASRREGGNYECDSA